MRSVTVSFFFCLTAAWAQVPKSWTPELQMQVQTVGSVVPSPDGRLVVWTQTAAVMETEKSEMVSQIFLAAADGSGRVQLTRGEKSATAPQFSPDGRFVYFQSERSGKPNIWRIAVTGGEADRIADWEGAIGSYKVSPDGKWIAFAGRKPDEDEEKAKKEKRDFRVVDENPKNHALWVVPVEPDAQGKRAARKLFEAPYHVTALEWSRDGRFLAFSHRSTPGADDWTKSDVSEIEVERGQVKPLAATRAAESEPYYSPDGRYLAYTVTSDPPRWPGEEHIALVDRMTGQQRLLPRTFDERPDLLGWSADSSRVIFTEAKLTRSAVYSIAVDGPPAQLYEPARGVLSGANLNSGGTHIGFSMESSSEAPEAFLLPLAGAGSGPVPRATPARVSAANLDLLKPPLGETKVIRWKAKDGLEIEGLLTLPAGQEQGKRYPLILNIHGGPASVFTESFIGRPGIYPLAAFAARGYAVLRPNPRGSGGYRKSFRFANVNDWGGKDYEDLMTGVDHVIAMGVADPDRLAVMGWSYGGYMTSWVIGHTSRFKAAVIGAPVTNLWSFTGTADISSFLPDYFGGEPWENFEAYRAHSPMSYVKGATTPALILHGEADDRVPISQGYELYNALKRQGATVKMVVYPRTPHGVREPKFMLDVMQRHLDWVEKYVR